MRTNELILYKNMEYEELLLDMTFLMEHYDNEYYNQEDLKGLLFSCMNELLELSECHGFFGNLWLSCWQMMKMLTVPPARSRERQKEA